MDGWVGYASYVMGIFMFNKITNFCFKFGLNITFHAKSGQKLIIGYGWTVLCSKIECCCSGLKHWGGIMGLEIEIGEKSWVPIKNRSAWPRLG